MKVAPEFVIALVTVMPLKVVAEDVAKVKAPVCAVPDVCVTERTPVLVMDGATDPTTVKPEHETPEEQVADDVATLANVLGPEKYERLPTTAADEVERPPKERALPVRAIGKETERGPW